MKCYKVVRFKRCWIWRYDCNGRKSSTAVINYKKIKLNVSIEVPKAELFIEEELLIRVLVNLIDNAIKFSYPNSEVHLRIYKEGTKLIFSVSDNGIGFNLTRERS
jgi:signal transduction histidine kinase